MAFQVPARFDHVVVLLVVAAPEHDGRMMSQPPDDALDFLADVFEVRRHVEKRPHGKHEVMPDHQAVLVAEIVEHIRLVQAAAPQPDHVEMGCGARAQEAAVMGFRQPLGQRVGRHPVGPLAEDPAAVHPEPERLSPVVALPLQIHGTQPDAPAHPVNLPVAVPERRDDPVKRLLPPAVGPPEPGILNSYGLFHAIRSDRDCMCLQALSLQEDFQSQRQGTMRIPFYSRRHVQDRLIRVGQVLPDGQVEDAPRVVSR